MFTRINLSDFRDAFRSAGRKDQFSYDGLKVLFDYLDDVEDYVLDVVEVCCDYSEMTPDEVIESYGIPYDAAEDDLWDTVRDYLEDRTIIVGETDDTIVLANF